MSIWTCVLGWFRFTVPDSTADEVMSRIGGEWIKDKKGFLGYRQGWLSRGPAGGLGRIGTGPAGLLVKCMWISPKSSSVTGPIKNFTTWRRGCLKRKGILGGSMWPSMTATA